MPFPAALALPPATAPAVSAALAAEADAIGNATNTPTVNAVVGRVRVRVDSTSAAISSRNIARPRDNRCLTVSELRSSFNATSVTDFSSR